MDANNDVTFYINGKFDSKATHTDPGFASNGTTRIGTRIGVGGFPFREFQGEIDELRVWDGVRSATEINNNKDIPLTGNEANLLALWHFDEPVNFTKIYDAGPNDISGSL